MYIWTYIILLASKREYTFPLQLYSSRYRYSVRLISLKGRINKHTIYYYWVLYIYIRTYGFFDSVVTNIIVALVDYQIVFSSNSSLLDWESVIRSCICISSNHRRAIYEIVHASLPGYRGLASRNEARSKGLVQELATPRFFGKQGYL